MKAIEKLLSFILFFSFTTTIYAQDWPQYLGPDRNSTSPQKNLLRSWPENGPEILWTVDIGKGFGGPVVKDGKVYLLDRNDEVGDKMRCFELSTGKELWNFTYDSPGTVMFPGSRSVPVVDDDFVYSCGHNGDLYCININTHKAVWNKNVWTDFGGEDLPRWAISQCPLIYGELLILASQAPEAGVVAFDKITGDLKWKTASLGAVGYVSPALVKIYGEDHVVMITASKGRRGEPQTGGQVVGIHPETGLILWEYENWQCRIPAPTAFDAGDNKLLIVGGYRAGASFIKIEKDSDNYMVTEIFKTEEFGSHTKPPILYEEHFYVQYRTNERRDGMVCMNMKGEIKWKTKRDPDFNKGSMILADGLILATDGAKGLYLIEPNGSEFKEIASFDLLNDKPADDQTAGRFATQNWAPIALADGKLLIRDQSRMMCVKVAE